MPEQTSQIAARIRNLREIAGLSVEQTAGALDVPVATYAAYEAGTADVPVGFLSEFAHHFGAELGSLLSGEEPKLHVYAVTRKGRGTAVERRTGYGYRALADNFVGKRAEPFEVTVGAESAEGPFSLNSHPGQEFDIVLEGTLRVSVAGHEVVLAEGDSIYYDSSHPHGMKAAGPAPARFLAIIF